MKKYIYIYIYFYIFRSPVSKGEASKTRYCVLYEAVQSLVIIVYVCFLETLLKDLTNDMNSENFA